MSQEMEEEILTQHDLFRRIARAVENLKKKGAANITSGVIKARLQALEATWSDFEARHRNILRSFRRDLAGHDYLRQDTFAKVEEVYLEQKSVFLDALSSMENEAAARPSSVTPSGSAQAPRTTLPRIQLSNFSGKYEEWPAFRDLFLSIFGKDSSTTPVEKLHYLKSCLSEEAELLVRNLPTTDANFDRAWSTLIDFYENKRLLVRAYLSKFTSLPKLKGESASDLRGLFHCVRNTADALDGLGRPISRSEDLFVHWAADRLDPRSRREWEFALRGSMEPPSYADFHKFLEERLHALEALQLDQAQTSPAKPCGQPMRRTRSLLTNKLERPRDRCVACHKDHILMACEKFKGKTAKERKQFAEKNNRCLNCLGGHGLKECGSTRTCSICSERHHTLLHNAYSEKPTEVTSISHHTKRAVNARPRVGPGVLLATARVRVIDRFGQGHSARALIDQGSETSLISEALVQRLKLSRVRSSVTVFGVGGTRTGSSRGRAIINITPREGGRAMNVSALILPRITLYEGGPRTDCQSWSHLSGLDLADPEFLASDPVDILLGAEEYAAILETGLRKGGVGEPVAQRTSLGWIISGASGVTRPFQRASSHQCRVDRELIDLVKGFWQQEELPGISPLLTREEKACEDFFVATHTRRADGRYIVRLPVREPLPDLRQTRATALRVLGHLERRFERDAHLQESYKDFMQTYEEMKHMSRHPPAGTTTERISYLPHHGVMRGSSSSSKLRVVFNGSTAISSGATLNQFLMVGANLLPALCDVLLRWRRHRYVLATDVEKMFRQVLVHEEDRDLQRILWRYSSSDVVQEYSLNTVTYGLACAPFLAMRTLRQLADDEKDRFPRGAEALRQDTYMDDVLTGSDTLEDAMELRRQLNELTMAGGFPLSKWAANDERLLVQIPEKRLMQGALRAWQPHEYHAMLGILWHPGIDCFSFSVQEVQMPAVTKRSVLSLTARLFDPLGWLAPTVVKAKIAFQATWLRGLDWDDPLDEAAAKQWRKYAAELPLLERIRVPRWIYSGAGHQGIELHGFSDASERAYAAAIYLRVRGEDRGWEVTLLTARTKVAPLKLVSLPRLELCAAVLLARLAVHVRVTLDLLDAPLHLWSDSTVSLGWIRNHPTRWTTYVANRVSEIQTAVPEASWHHVPGYENPADCASRGLSPGDLETHALWWQGPPWLREDLATTSTLAIQDHDLPEERVRVHAAATTKLCVEEPAELLRFSSLHRLLRTTAWCRRWLPAKASAREARRDPAQLRGSTLASEEIEEARLGWVRLVQGMHYDRDLEALRRGQTVTRSSQIVGLSPLLDSQGLLRVGGRIKHALLAYDERHPVILPPHSHLTGLVVDASHRRSLHGGIQLTLGITRQRYWIPKGRSVVKRAVLRCVTCARWRAAIPQQYMGSLPKERVTPARAFLHTGVDYAGPIQLRTTKGRGHKSYKAFIAVFVCLSTRAVHLEAVSDYTAEAFLAAFRRFISRRGLCETVHSDCGTNFVGADKQLRALFAASSPEQQRIVGQLAKDHIRWRFNPPAAPHFGGIWEAAVKSLKHHLRRTLGETTLTYEEMATLLAQIEACLNSRPLQALSDDPDDLAALTPGHFLIGSALIAVPEPTLLEHPSNRLTRWRLLQQMRDHFWQRWSREYLLSLLRRPKWHEQDSSFREGRLCLLRNEATPPGRWPLARIVRTHPGEDGQVRVVTVRTATSEFVRPIVKLVLLPTENDGTVI